MSRARVGRALRRCLLSCLLLAPLSGGALVAQAAPESGSSLQVYLMTMGPGAEIWERFGHNAIWIHDSVSGQDRIYNYGMFSFGEGLLAELDFYRKFAMGHPMYRLAVDTDFGYQVELYSARHRSMIVQQLRLTPQARFALAQRLATNAEPGNAEYPYDYFLDNCSTRVRDMLDQALGGALRAATVGKPAEGTYRFHTLRSLTNSVALYLGIDAGLGSPVDRPLDQWGEMFLPAKVMARVAELQVPGPDGSPVPLVMRQMRLVDSATYTVAAAPPRWGWKLLGASLVLGLILSLGRLEGRLGTAGRVMSRCWLVVIGLVGCLILFLWFFTAHSAAAHNKNVAIFTPLALLLVLSARKAVAAHRSRWPIVWMRTSLYSVILGSIAALLPQLVHQEYLPLVEATAIPSCIAIVVIGRWFSQQLAAAPRPPA